MARLCDKIGIVGAGVCGTATARAFLEYCGEMRIYDIVPEKASHTLAEAMDCDFVFASVPTNGLPDGSYDLTHLRTFCESIRGSRANIALRSTVLPGTSRSLAREFALPGLSFVPEHLTERCSLIDAICPARNVIGYLDEHDFDSSLDLAHLFSGRFPGAQCLLMSAESAEMEKLAINFLFSLKILAWNQIYDACQKSEANFDDVKEAILADGRISTSHCEVLMSSGRGAGGKCLVPETLVYEQNRGKIRIADVAVGESVWNGKSFALVTAKACRVVDKTFTINVRGRTLSGSLDHIHIVDSPSGRENTQLASVAPGDRCILALPPAANPGNATIKIGKVPAAHDAAKLKAWNDEITVTPDIAWTIGLWLADGCKLGRPGRYAWCLGLKKEQFVETVVNVLRGFGLNPSAKICYCPNATYGPSTTIKVDCSGMWLEYFFQELGVSGGSRTKQMKHRLPPELSKYVVGGWLDGDGCSTAGTISGHSESRLLIGNMDDMLKENGVCGVITKGGKGIAVSTRLEAEKVCGWTKRHSICGDRYKRSFSYASPTMTEVPDGWSAIVRETSISEESSEVVAIEVEGEEYVANGILTHNCLAKEIAAFAYMQRTYGNDHEMVSAADAYNKRLLAMPVADGMPF